MVIQLDARCKCMTWLGNMHLKEDQVPNTVIDAPFVMIHFTVAIKLHQVRLHSVRSAAFLISGHILVFNRGYQP